MLKQNSELRAQAREALRGKWPMAAVAALIYSAIAGGLSSIPFIGWIGSLLVGLPVAYGFAVLMLGVFRGAEEVDLGVLFAGFQEYSRILSTKLLQAVYTFLVQCFCGILFGDIFIFHNCNSLIVDVESIGEVDLLFTLRRNGETGHADVNLTAGNNRRDDSVELEVLVLIFETELFSDCLAQLNFEANHFVTFEIFEWWIVGRKTDYEFAVVEQGIVCRFSVGVFGFVVRRATEQANRRDQGEEHSNYAKFLHCCSHNVPFVLETYLVYS